MKKLLLALLFVPSLLFAELNYEMKNGGSMDLDNNDPMYNMGNSTSYTLKENKIEGSSNIFINSQDMQGVFRVSYDNWMIDGIGMFYFTNFSYKQLTVSPERLDSAAGVIYTFFQTEMFKLSLSGAPVWTKEFESNKLSWSVRPKFFFRPAKFLSASVAYWHVWNASNLMQQVEFNIDYQLDKTRSFILSYSRLNIGVSDNNMLSLSAVVNF